jgi:hypothetical protein
LASLLMWALLLSFSTWRITSLLHSEKMFRWLRTLIGIVDLDGEMAYPDPPTLLGSIWECFYCLSLYVAMVLAFIITIVYKFSFLSWFILSLSSSAGALWVEKRIGVSRARL